MEQTITKPVDLTKRKHFDILDGSMACVLFIVLQYLLGFAIAIFGGIKNRFMYDLFSAVMQAAFIGSVILIAKIRKVDWVEACNFKKKVDGKIVLYALGFAIICMILFTDATSAFVAFLEKIGYSSPLENSAFAEYNQITNVWEYLLSIVTVCIIPPICEETLFRGAVLNSFRGTNKWLGIFVSAFCFMIMHGNPDQTVHQFILGVVLGYIAWETRNIWVSILIHAINNLIAITISFAYTIISSNIDTGVIEGAAEATTYSWNDIVYTAISGVLTAALGIYLVILLTKKLKKYIENKKAAANANDASKSENNTENVEMLVTQDGKTTVIESVENAITYQEKPSKRKIVFTVLTYVAFIAYFLKEWIGYLLLGLGL